MQLNPARLAVAVVLKFFPVLRGEGHSMASTSMRRPGVSL